MADPSSPLNITERILIIKLGALGDFIQACGPMAAIRNHHPKAKITLLTTMPFKGLAEKTPFFDDIWIDEKPSWHEFKKWASFKKRLNKAGFSRIYDLQNNDRSRFYFRLMSKPKPQWVGTAKGASHRNVSVDRTKGHAYDGHVQTLALAGIKNVPVDQMKWLDEEISNFPLKEPYVLIVPGSSPEHPHKRWPVESYIALIKLLGRMGFQSVIIGAQSEHNIAKNIIKSCPEALNLCYQTTLGQISSLARGAAGAIGNDTGPMHLIAVTSCPSVVLFSGASNREKHSPQGANVQVLQSNDLKDLDIQDVINVFRPKHEPEPQSITMH